MTQIRTIEDIIEVLNANPEIRTQFFEAFGLSALPGLYGRMDAFETTQQGILDTQQGILVTQQGILDTQRAFQETLQGILDTGYSGDSRVFWRLSRGFWTHSNSMARLWSGRAISSWSTARRCWSFVRTSAL